jgi:hypothetical protein
MINRIVNKINESKGNKKGRQSFYELSPCEVGETMPESNEIIKDLARIQYVKFL